jgi:hypothetical protein
VFKKIEKSIKLKKPEKNNRKNRTVKKKLIKPIKILKKPEKNRAKLKKASRNRAKPKKQNQTSLNRFLL